MVTVAEAVGTKRRPYRRDQIAGAAMRLFSERGYRATTMDDIGAAAGITGPGIYRHFKGKEEILDSAIRAIAEETLARTRGLAATNQDPAALLDAFVGEFADRAARDPHSTFVVMRERRELPEPTRGWLNRSERTYVKAWVQTLRALRPELSDVEARVLVYAVLNAALGAAESQSGLRADQLAALVKRAMLGALLG
jgi:AcrR family transcriptional regulator